MKMTDVTKPARKLLNLKLKRCGAVIVAAGSASRMGGIDKVMAPLCDEPMIVHTVRAFQDSPVIRQIVVVTRRDLIREVTDLCSGMNKVVAVVEGGADRQASVEAGISALSSKMALVAIHDGARPLIAQAVIDRTVRAAHTYSAAAPGIPVKDTIKVAKGNLVESTPDRSFTWMAQTPQCFKFELALSSYNKAIEKGDNKITDDAMVVRKYGNALVSMLEGGYENIKVTTPEDIMLAECFLKMRFKECQRVGHD